MRKETVLKIVNCVTIFLSDMVSRKSIIYFTFLLLISALCNAQDFSNKGKDFWIAYPAHYDGLNSIMGIYITAETDATGTISFNGNSISFSVTANQVTRKFLGSSTGVDGDNSGVYLTQMNGIQSNAGIHITSNRNIVVYAHIIYNFHSAATLVLPTSVLGVEYLVPSYQNEGQGADKDSYSELAVVATKANTTIEFVPTANGRDGTPAGTTITKTLVNIGDSYQFQSELDGDLSGTVVKSISSGTEGCKPIAVFSATTWTKFGCGTSSSGRDNLLQQLFPTRSWGKNFITAPFINRPFDIFRIFVLDPSTVVSITENGVTTQLSSGNYNPVKKCYEIETNNALFVSADKPISVVQYIVSQSCKTGCVNSTANQCLADPEMVILNPIEQSLNNITFFSAHKNFVPSSQTNVILHYVNVIIDKNYASTVKVDNNSPKGNFIAIPGTNYAYLQEDLTSSSANNPVHNIKADTTFSAIVYGYGNFESYGYNGGTNIKDLYQYVSIKNPLAVVNYPATCTLTPFVFSITFPYQPTSIGWKFFGLFSDTTVNNPIADSVWIVNGRTLYHYTLPKSFLVNAVGSYPVTVIAQNPTSDGCSGEQQIDYTLEVYQRPQAVIVNDRGICLNDEIQFSDNSNTYGRSEIKWNWFFGDGSFSAVKNPVHKYISEGKKIIKFNIVTDIGCVSDTAEKTITLYESPRSKFSVVSDYCLGNAVQLVDASASLHSLISKWSWKMSDDSAAFIRNSGNPFDFIYGTSGQFNITLTTENDKGCQGDTVTKQVKINPVPVASFDLPDNCVNDPVINFTNGSSIADGTENLFKYLWNFGDPNSSPLQNTSTVKTGQHKYSQAGTYVVTLNVTSNNNCSVVLSQPFTVNGSVPVTDFSVSDNVVCSSDSVRIINNSFVDIGRITQLEIFWDFVNDLTKKTTIIHPVRGAEYAFRNPGFYKPSQASNTIKVIGYSGDNCLSSKSGIYELVPLPEIKFDTILPLCSNAPSVLLNQASIQNELTGTGNYSGNGVSDNVFNPGKATVGQNVLKYIFTTDNGCKDSASKTLLVYNVPKVDAGADKTIIEGNTTILNGSIIPGTNLKYFWSPAESLSGSTVLQPSADPVQSTEYKLQMITNEGCRDSDYVYVKVLQEPKVPNTFSPNGDGQHDLWEIESLNTYNGCVVDVFNRYGEKVFHAEGYITPWDGKYNNKDLPAGTYYYIINPKNGHKVIAGFVDIIR